MTSVYQVHFNDGDFHSILETFTNESDAEIYLDLINEEEGSVESYYVTEEPLRETTPVLLTRYCTTLKDGQLSDVREFTNIEFEPLTDRVQEYADVVSFSAETQTELLALVYEYRRTHSDSPDFPI